MRATITTIILMTILAITLLVSYKSVMAKTDGSSGVPFAQDDRDRIIRLEEGQKSLHQQINDLRNLMYAAQRSIWTFYETVSVFFSKTQPYAGSDLLCGEQSLERRM